MEPGRERVDWPTVASVLVAARFCSQRSELGIAEGWYEKTALEDLLGPRFSNGQERSGAASDLPPGCIRKTVFGWLYPKNCVWVGLLFVVFSSAR